jgi:hypothetical protein
LEAFHYISRVRPHALPNSEVRDAAANLEKSTGSGCDMHEPLPREFRTNDAQTGAPGLVWACALVVIVAVAVVGIALIAGEISLGSFRQIALSTDASAAPSTGYLVSGMPQP